MNCPGAFRLSPSGFPLYLCSLSPLLVVELVETTVTSTGSVPIPASRIPLAKDAAPIPNAIEAAIKKRIYKICLRVLYLR